MSPEVQNGGISATPPPKDFNVFQKKIVEFFLKNLSAVVTQRACKVTRQGYYRPQTKFGAR